MFISLELVLLTAFFVFCCKSACVYLQRLACISCICNVHCDRSVVLILSVNDGQLAVSDATVSWLDSFEVSLWMICLPQLTFLSDNM